MPPKAETPPSVVDPPPSVVDPPPPTPEKMAPEEVSQTEETAREDTSVLKKASPPKKNKKGKTDAESEISEVSCTSTSVSSRAEKKRRPPKKNSTRTPSSYVLFSMEERKKIVAANAGLGLGEVSKLCGSAWKALDNTCKEEWIALAKEMKEKRLQENKQLEAEEPTKKKRKPSSYLLFAMEHRKLVLKDNPAFGIGDVSKACGKAWNALSEEEKATWKLKASDPVA